MKIHLLLLTGLLAAGCHQESNQGELTARLKSLETEIAKMPRSAPVRWAIADREKIQSVLNAHAQAQSAALEKAEGVSPEIRAKLAEYETLNRELMEKWQLSLPTRFVPTRTLRPLPNLSDFTVPPVAPAAAPPTIPSPPEVSAEAKAYAALGERVAAAKAPVAHIVDRRLKLFAKYHGHEFLEQLVSEYAKGRYDLVVEANGRTSSERSVLYNSAAGPPVDLTEEIIKSFREREQKSKP